MPGSAIADSEVKTSREHTRNVIYKQEWGLRLAGEGQVPTP